MRRYLRRLGVVVAVALFSSTGDDASHAQGAPLPGWAPIGQVQLDKSGCASCPATFSIPSRHRSFGLATDSPFPVTLSGRIDVTCANGSTYDVLLRSSPRAGIFQVVPSSCVNLDTKEIKLTVTSLSLSPADENRTVVLTVYGKIG